MQHHQMTENLLYHVQKIEDWKNLVNDLNDADFYELYNSDHKDTINLTNDISFAEDEYESVISNLDSLIKCLGYAKKVVGLALETGCENELNKLLRNWINETKRKMSYNLNEFNNENLPNITNSYLMHMKSAPKKHLKSILENYAFKHHNQKTDKLTQRINKYTEDLDDNR
ncbi:229_t:CDS:2 [Cetraspora pellucida]|uniref:229_t:CDS:1 n=1 Tax=Cetraspora pellucida TaxID=1433469 RepID=A0A9N9FIC7_9GLOM|nr:229_t:CDS:2 [Cetraspora pellucida]